MDGLKQRIIGALVLISLAVIFVPMVFDEPHSERTSTSINIPEEPPFPEVETPEMDLATPPAYRQNTSTNTDSANQGFRILEDEDEAARTQPIADTRPQAQPEVAKPAPSENTEQKPETPAVSQSQASMPEAPEASTEPTNAEFTRSLEGAWVVQLASFGNASNARRLRDNVRKEGYNSHLQEVVRGEATLTRVFSGPFAEKAEAEAAKRALDETFKLNSLVTSGGK
ncbi:SPOR domain-containing protein [Marinobacter salexigens]|uniref:SPOR domain-containing protein n=1 Tax=Marinobacter salexigens TaxID=1925763 RepID=UPI000C288B28|nr:SPOR domain-containing protein [Marinobacter salexigens]